MKKYLFFLLMVLAMNDAKAQTLENSLLWKVSGHNIEGNSYLFGTIHITCDATLNDKVKQALKKSGQMVLEVDMDNPQTQTDMMSVMAMDDGKTLKDLISEEEFNLVDGLFIRKVGMSVTTMQNVRPYLLSATLYPKLIDCPMQSIDGELVKQAQELGLEIKGLETVEEMITAFEAIPYDDHISDLIRSAKDDLAYDKQHFSRMTAAYNSEQINEMLEILKDKEFKAIAGHQDKLLDQRNKNWMLKMVKYLKEQPTFFAFGAAHLAGENGVIQLLRKEGYVVEPVR